MTKLRIVLAEDHQMVREGLRGLITSQGDMEVVGETENGRIAVDLAERLEPDVVVMDISMPELNGFEATARLTKSRPQVKILVLIRYTSWVTPGISVEWRSIACTVRGGEVPAHQVSAHRSGVFDLTGCGKTQIGQL
jgi:chemotaxis response regulator CheB